MAKRKAEKEANPEKDLLTRIRERYKVMSEADQENRRCALEDLKFVNEPGAQWDANMKKERGDRPCYEFNKVRITCKRVINDIRSNRPAGKVRAVEGGDKGTADIYEGLIRNIENSSDFDTVMDYAAEYQVPAGMGAWRILTKYNDDSAFEQDIAIEALQNPFCLYWDPAAKDPLKRDAQDWIVTDKISKKAYEARWPKAQKVDWESTEFDDESDWSGDEFVRIAEYWYKEPYDKELWQLADGKVIDAASDEARSPQIQAQVKKRRNVVCQRIKMCIASGDAILEMADWAGSKFPFVVVFGEYVVIDGKLRWFGLARFAKDAQRSYNVSRTAIDETIALAPQAKWWATADQALGHTDKWAEAHQKNFPFLLYNGDPKANGPPQRLGGADVPVALTEQSMLASEDVKAVMGIFDASLGARGNETSGKAINARQQQGEIATFNYRDNMGKAKRLTCEILIDLIPHIYDTERELRVLGTDGAEDYVRVNTFALGEDGISQVKVNDLATGRYDVTVTVGPSWATKRMEASEVYMNMGQAFPPLMQFAGDLIVKSMDLPYSEDIAERIQAMLPPPIQQMLSDGKNVPPEAQAAMAQAAQAMQQVQQQGLMVQQAAEEASQEKAEAEKAKAAVEQAIAKLETKKAQFDAYVEQQIAKLAQAEAKAAQRGAQDGVAGERESLAAEQKQVLANIETAVAQFFQQALATVAEMQARGQPVVNVPARPRIKEMRGKRVNGEMVAVPIYEDAAEPVQ